MKHHQTTVSMDSLKAHIINSAHVHNSGFIKEADIKQRLSAKVMVYALASLLVFQPLLVSAQTIVSGTTQTQQTIAKNGVPIINIATPSAQGVSHNQFQQFNVEQQGLILNNAKATTDTQLGGFIEANPNLQASNTAKIIINEVTSPNRSQLNGYTEVAGEAANVVIANPYGISCNGCGFINTPRATLTTGLPVISNGTLTGLTVNGGDVQIEGLGLNASNISQFDIITRVISLNADLHAKELNIVLGTNEVDYSSLNVTNIQSDNKPEFALDSTALGGMYANAIRLVGTEMGVGVKALGNVAVDAGGVHLSADGKISLAKVESAGSLSINSRSADIQLTQDVSSSDSIELTAKTAIGIIGVDLLSKQSLSIHAASLYTKWNSRLLSSADTAISVSKLNNFAKIESQGTLEINADIDIFNAGVLEAKALTLSTPYVTNYDYAKIESQGTLEINADYLTNEGKIFGDEVSLTSTLLHNGAREFACDGYCLSNSVIGATSKLSLFSDDISNGSSAIIYSLGDLFIAADQHNNRTQSILNISGSIEADRDLSIYADTLTNRRDYISTGSRTLSSSPIVKKYVSEQEKNRLWSEYWPYLADEYNVERIWKEGDTDVDETILYPGPPRAVIRAGRNIELNISDSLDNIYSDIIAANELKFDIGTLNNIGGQRETTTSEYGQYIAKVYKPVKLILKTSDSSNSNTSIKVITPDCSRPSGSDAHCLHQADFYNTISTTFSPLPGLEAVFSGNKVINGRAQNIKNGISESTSDNGILGEKPVSKPSLPLNRSLFSVETNLASLYLVKTNAFFANHKQLISSDYILENLGLDVEAIPKRLGDAFYEQRIVQEQIRQLTGSQYLLDAKESDQQYRDLMIAGLAEAASLKLRPYITLTKQQIAALTKDIVWMEYETITLDDGKTETVLSPKVYLASVSQGINQSGAALILGDKLQLVVDNTVSNNGLLIGNNQLALQAHDINNVAGYMSSQGDVAISAQKNINNSLGRIQGNNVNLAAEQSITTGSLEADKDLSIKAGDSLKVTGVALSAKNDLTIQAKTVSVTALARKSKIGKERRVTHQKSMLTAGRNLSVDASQDITVTGSTLTGKQGLALNAGRDITINAAEDTSNIDVSDGGRKLKTARMTNLSSTLNSNNNITLDAGKNIGIIGSTITAGKDIVLKAKGDTNIASVQDTYYSFQSHTKKRSFGRKKTTIIEKEQYRNKASELNAGRNVTINADMTELGIQSTAIAGNVSIIGSDISAKDNIAIAAANTLTVSPGVNYDYSRVETRKKGFGGFTSSNRTNTSQQQRQQAAKATSGDSLNLRAGSNITLIAPKLQSDGDINISSERGTVTLATAKDSDIQHEEYSKTGAFSWEAGNKGQSDETIRHTDITAKGDIRIHAGNGLIVEYKQNGTLEDSIDSLSQLPELAWMNTLQQRNDIDWQAIEEAHDKWAEHEEGIGGPGLTILTAAVAIATAGAGAQLLGLEASATAGNLTAVQSAQLAAVNSLVTQSITNLVVTGGDITAVLDRILSGESINNIVVTSLSAGFGLTSPLSSEISTVDAGIIGVSAIDPELAGLLSFVTGNLDKSLGDITGNAIQYVARKEIAEVAERHGLTAQEFNLLLTINSFVGKKVAGTTYNPKMRTIDGFFSRDDSGLLGNDGSTVGGIWDINDSLLNAQGYLDAISQEAAKDGASPILGHSLGAWRTNNLASRDLVGSATLLSLPLFAYPNSNTTGYCGGLDGICGGDLFNLLRVNTQSVNSPSGWDILNSNHAIDSVPAYGRIKAEWKEKHNE